MASRARSKSAATRRAWSSGSWPGSSVTARSSGTIESRRVGSALDSEPENGTAPGDERDDVTRRLGDEPEEGTR
ncbi:hypothetical protein GCM10027073_72370 [Streptomyces chlorus]